MKQFQVVQQIPDTNNGLIVANFGLPILIAPNSQITLDKFQATINTTSTNINLLDQIVKLTTDGITYTDIFIPAQIYLNTAILINTFNDYINSAFNAYDDFTNNRGLEFSTQNTNNNIEFNYSTVDNTQIVVQSPVDCDFISDIWIFDGGAPGSWSGTDSRIVLNGGGFICSSQMRPDIVGGLYTIQFGLQGNIGGIANQSVYIKQSLAASPSSFGVVSLESTLTNASIIIPSVEFVSRPGFTFIASFYQKNGYYAFQITAENPLNPIQTIFTYELEDLGKWSSLDSTTPYFSGATLDLVNTPYVNLNTNPGFGNFTMTQSGGPAGGARTLILDFDKAEQFRLGFGLPVDLIILTPTNSDTGSYSGIGKVDFSSIRAALTVSIEVMELPLESYIVGTTPFQTKNPTKGVRQQGARVNVIGYFTPETKDSASNIFRYQASEYQWLDIINKQPMEFTSLNFRVYITETGQPLQATNLSFNILTRTQDEKMLKEDNKKYIG